MFLKLAMVAHDGMWSLIFRTVCMCYSKICSTAMKTKYLGWDEHCNEIRFFYHNTLNLSMPENTMYVYPYSMWSMLVGRSNQFLYHIRTVNNDNIQTFHVYDIHLTDDEYISVDRSYEKGQHADLKPKLLIAIACLPPTFLLVLTLGIIYH